MDAILAIFVNWQFLMFGMAVAAVVYVLRKIVEFILDFLHTIIKSQVAKYWIDKCWNDAALPIIPVVLGVVGALKFTTYPYPDGLTTEGDRVIFGLVAGLLSTLFYRVVKSLLVQKIQSVLPAAVPVANGTPVPPTTPDSDTVDPVDPVADGKAVIDQAKQIIK